MALVAPGPSKPGKLLLQYSSHLSLGATSPFLPLSPELALRGASASSSPSLRRRSLHHCHVWTLTGRRLERDGPRGDDSRVQSACTRHLPWRRARGARRCGPRDATAAGATPPPPPPPPLASAATAAAATAAATRSPHQPIPAKPHDAIGWLSHACHTHATRMPHACHTHATNPRRASPPTPLPSPPAQADGELKLTLQLQQRGRLRVVASQPAPAQMAAQKAAQKAAPPQRPPPAPYDPASHPAYPSNPPAPFGGGASLAGPHGMRSCGLSVGRRNDGFTAGGFMGGRGGGMDGGAAGQPWRGVRWAPPREALPIVDPTRRG